MKTTTDTVRNRGAWHVAAATGGLLALGLLLTVSGGAAGGIASPLPAAIESDRPVDEAAAAPTPAETPAPSPAVAPAPTDERGTRDAPGTEDAEGDDAEPEHEVVRPTIRDEDPDRPDGEDDDDSDSDSDSDSDDDTETPKPRKPAGSDSDKEQSNDDSDAAEKTAPRPSDESVETGDR